MKRQRIFPGKREIHGILPWFLLGPEFDAFQLFLKTTTAPVLRRSHSCPTWCCFPFTIPLDPQQVHFRGGFGNMICFVGLPITAMYISLSFCPMRLIPFVALAFFKFHSILSLAKMFPRSVLILKSLNIVFRFLRYSFAWLRFTGFYKSLKQTVIQEKKKGEGRGFAAEKAAWWPGTFLKTNPHGATFSLLK